MPSPEPEILAASHPGSRTVDLAPPSSPTADAASCMLSQRLPSASPAAARFPDEAIEQFVRLVRGRHDQPVTDHIQGLLDGGMPVESVYLELLAPAARRLGELWDNDQCDFVEVTVALGRLQRLVRSFSRLFISDVDPADIVGRVLLSSLPGEQHTLGLFMVAEFFVRDGWLVSVNHAQGEGELWSLLRDEWFDVVGFSLACDSHLSNVGKVIRRARKASRNPALQVLVGGRIFNEHPDLVASVGADGTAHDGRAAPAVAASMLARCAAPRAADRPAH